jgi:opacity protein-like surface antigen
MSAPRLLTSALLLAAVLAGRAASAQVIQPRAPQRSSDLSFGGTWAMPTSVGKTSLVYLDNNRQDFTVFDASNRFGNGFGIDINLGFRVTRRLFAEGVGAWTHVPLESKISGDIEAGEEATVSESASRFAVGGAARVHLTEGKTEWFVRGGVSWMREVAAGSALTGDGMLTDAGVGLIRALTRRPNGILKTGVRVEGRLSFRSGGLSLGKEDMSVGLVIAGALTLGFR